MSRSRISSGILSIPRASTPHSASSLLQKRCRKFSGSLIPSSMVAAFTLDVSNFSRESRVLLAAIAKPSGRGNYSCEEVLKSYTCCCSNCCTEIFCNDQQRLQLKNPRVDLALYVSSNSALIRETGSYTPHWIGPYCYSCVGVAYHESGTIQSVTGRRLSRSGLSYLPYQPH